MDGYIKRADAINYIHENQCSSCSDVGLCGNCAVVISLKMLEKVPAADVEKIIRCRNCVWHQFCGMNHDKHKCRLHNIEVGKDDFCSKGKVFLDG